jgi:hypothetical protein
MRAKLENRVDFIEPINSPLGPLNSPGLFSPSAGRIPIFGVLLAEGGHPGTTLTLEGSFDAFRILRSIQRISECFILI